MCVVVVVVCFVLVGLVVSVVSLLWLLLLCVLCESDFNVVMVIEVCGYFYLWICGIF